MEKAVWRSNQEKLVMKWREVGGMRERGESVDPKLGYQENSGATHYFRIKKLADVRRVKRWPRSSLSKMNWIQGHLPRKTSSVPSPLGIPISAQVVKCWLTLPNASRSVRLIHAEEYVTQRPIKFNLHI